MCSWWYLERSYRLTPTVRTYRKRPFATSDRLATRRGFTVTLDNINAGPTIWSVPLILP
jgi:hypothetical protein